MYRPGEDDLRRHQQGENYRDQSPLGNRWDDVAIYLNAVRAKMKSIRAFIGKHAVHALKGTPATSPA